MSAKERKERIVADIIEDFSLKPRLANDRGTAMLVVNEIFDACHYFRLFHNTLFAPLVGIITSYEPNHSAISTAPVNGDERYKYETYRQFVLPDGTSAQQYEQRVKQRFIEEPAQMKLLIVVSKLLTGFDAPSCSYIYLDKRLHDHTLFQAICRTNRLDGDDKDYGHIVDYERQFQDVQQVIAIYNSDELDDEAGMDAVGNNIHVHHWLDEGRKQLDAAHEALHYLCEPVALPRDLEQYLHYFCGHAQDPHALEQTEALRIAFYQSVAAFLRAFANLATHLADAGYTDNEAERLRQDAGFYALVRSAIKHYSGEELDIKPFEADMRHLINTYTQADPAQILGELDTLPLTELIIKSGIHEAIVQKLNVKGHLSNNAIAETIINNVRKTIIRDRLTDPRFYAHMSTLLDDLIQQERKDVQAYEQFLRDAERLVRQLDAKHTGTDAPAALHGNPVALTLWRNLPDIVGDMQPSDTHTVREPAAVYGDPLAHLALKIERCLRENAPADWRGDEAKERIVQNLLYEVLGELLDDARAATVSLFELIKHQADGP